MRQTRLRTLYVCYHALEDPLIQTQVVAYLEGLASRGHTIHLLTYDEPLDEERRKSSRADLQRRGIVWHSLRYHKRPSLPATVYDVLVGSVVAAYLVRRHRLDAIHARNHVSAALALLARKLSPCRLIFDVRGLMAEEFVDAGRWQRGSLPYRITNWIQRVALRRADGVVVLTDALRDHLATAGPPSVPPEVIPCCVDLTRLNGRLPDRVSARRELGIGDRPVMVYVGKFTGWYMEREMADFYAAARKALPGLFFLILTQADPAPITEELERCGVRPDDHLITKSPPDEIGRYLAAADFGVSFVRPCFSKISSSPTKVAEYLAAGLPIVSTAIGDLEALFGGERIGVVIRTFSPAAYDAAAAEVRSLLDDPSCPERCHTVAHAQLSLQDIGVPRYDELYRRVAAL